MDWTAVSLCGTISILIWLLWRYSSGQKGKNSPPVERGLPLLGYVPFLRPNRYVALTALRKKLGDVFFVRFFTQNILIISSYDSLRDALINQADVFASRPIFRYMDSLNNRTGIVFTDGEKWQSHRRFVLRALRELGFGKSDSVDAIHNEITTLTDFIESNKNRPVRTNGIFSRLTANVICSLVFGESFSNDRNYEALYQAVDGLVEADTRPFENLPNFFPSMLDYPIIMNIFHRFTKRKRYFTTIITHMFDNLRKHAESIDNVTEPSNLVDIMLLHRRSIEDRGDKSHSFDDWSIAGDLLDLFIAGSDTTATSLCWAMALLSVHPDIQRRARQEIRNEIGLEQLPTMRDRSKLNYTVALLDEIARFGSIAPTSLFHKVKEDTTLSGYHIPKDTTVIPNLYAVHMDPKHWDNPSTFDPNHFLNKEGTYQPSEHLIPFSLGKRACLGESLARMELFIFFVAILQRYEVSLAKEDEANVSQILQGDDGIVRHLKDHKVLFKVVE